MIDVKFAVSVFFSRKVMKRSAIVALIVGTILAFINHGDVILTASLTPVCWIKMIATCFVPYTVSSVTAVLGALEQRREAHAGTASTRLLAACRLDVNWLLSPNLLALRARDRRAPAPDRNSNAGSTSADIWGYLNFLLFWATKEWHDPASELPQRPS